ncbi:MAG: hypothetical protein FJZ01_04905 [Candidatus Sericytochromatia bacterium]|nr:hypothetical protein [Candidatus Tanganyikabacteria bacterium]
MRELLPVVAALALLAPPAIAAEPRPLAPSGPYRPRLTLVDAPANLAQAYQVPTMRQALDLTRSLVEGVDWAVDLGFDHLAAGWDEGLRYGLEIPALAGATVLLGQIPLGAGWSHEEWHRAVMARHGIGSRNGFYSYPPFSDAIAVDHVTDDALATLKRSRPRDFVRLSAAGMEANVLLAREIRDEAFFDRRPLYRDIPAVGLTLGNVFFYLQGCASDGFDAMVDQKMAQEGADMARRDFAGADCLAWMYDLERFNEAYDGRGAHPSGVGIRRYRKSTDLSAEGRAFLGQARTLSLLNFAAPDLFGLPPLAIPGHGEWTFGLQHMLTSFGQVVQVELLSRSPEHGLTLGYHHFFNGARAFPGLEAALVRQPVRLGDLRLAVDVGAVAWLQPRTGSFLDTSEGPGGALRLGLGLPLSDRATLRLEGLGKTDGWLAGEVDLDAAWIGRAGLLLSL